MTVGVVVVAYGGAEPLGLALAPLRHLRIVVVDNSSDAEVARVAKAAGADYVDPGDNLGFGAGVNLGVRTLWDRERSDVLILNPDAVLPATALVQMQAELSRDDRIGVVAPRLVNPDGSPQRVLWNWPSPRAMWLEAMGLGRVNDRRSEWVVGAVLLVRQRAWEQVGEFDERFFLYQEETDWQRRAVAAGWEIRVADEAVAEHMGAGTSTDKTRRELLFHAGTETYIRKWFGPSGWLRYRTAAVLGAGLRGIVLPGEWGRSARRRARVYLRGPRSAAGLD